MTDLKKTTKLTLLLMGLALMLSIGIRWVLSIFLFVLLFLLALLGVNIELEVERLSQNVAIVSFIIAFVYLVCNNKQ